MANVIPINEIKPDRVILLAPKEQQNTVDNLANYLDAKKILFNIRSEKIDAFNPRTIRLECQEIIKSFKGENLILNATGGTKIMALAAAEIFSENNLEVIYVDHQNNNLVTISPPNKRKKPITGWLNIEDYLFAFGFRIVSEKTDTGRAENKNDFFDAVLKNGDLNNFIRFFDTIKSQIKEPTSPPPSTTAEKKSTDFSYDKFELFLSKGKKNYFIGLSKIKDLNTCLRFKKTVLPLFFEFCDKLFSDKSQTSGVVKHHDFEARRSPSGQITITYKATNTSLNFGYSLLPSFRNFILSIAKNLSPSGSQYIQKIPTPILSDSHFKVSQDDSGSLITHLQSNTSINFPYKNSNTGDWLEDLLFLSLKKNRPTPTDIKYGVIIEKDNVQREIDVICTRGYQLEIFSCKNKIKNDNNKLDLYELEILRDIIGGPYGKAYLVHTANIEYVKSLGKFLGIKVLNTLDIININHKFL